MTVHPAEGGAGTIDAGRLWAGGLATAIVAALVGLAGILLARGVFSVPVLAPAGQGTWGDADTTVYALSCAATAVLATALLHLLLVSTPQPLLFFGWIITLATVVAAIAPFVTKGSTSAKIATGAINLAVGIAIGVLLSGAGRSAVRRPPITARPGR
ncbi:hypothetical protein EV138_5792 [Kribbella voronezhensis]|uniref:Uncharacterized protein n=1 Tax=Kribbella voronezhensis TaxID=2512212 RepID=A0A4R7SY09_9ACTN|nr:DUF6069 family protein [Kribbella voronezhensis]TDU83328.1 hypothetical protein EV138_5792 [Kribbella voronezhensis]